MADLEKMIGRRSVNFASPKVGRFFEGRKILITGAGGTIGAALLRQLLPFNPARVVLADIDAQSLRKTLPRASGSGGKIAALPITIDLTDRDAVEQLFEAERPSIVFHAAAQKHVPLAEDEPGPAVAINVLGTRNVADAALRNEGDVFVLFSSDKAVNPVSVMGVTKRLAEQYIQSLTGDTRFVTVRCGNVIGSSGSVVPAFAKQIADGGPVVITDLRMRRYFMTIAESASLAMLAATGKERNAIYLMKMGEPVHIVDLARAMIDAATAAGSEPIDVHFSLPRPGEKLDEQLRDPRETPLSSPHPGVDVLQALAAPSAQTAAAIDMLEAARHHHSAALIRLLADLVPEYERAGHKLA